MHHIQSVTAPTQRLDVLLNLVQPARPVEKHDTIPSCYLLACEWLRETYVNGVCRVSNLCRVMCDVWCVPCGVCRVTFDVQRFACDI